MPYERRGKCVYKTTGELMKCHDTTAQADAHLAALRINVQAAEKAMVDIVDDADFWAAQRLTFMRRFVPLVRGWFIEGAQAAARERPRRAKQVGEDWQTVFDIEAINAAATEFIETYTSDFWERLEAGQRDRLRRAIATADANGLGPREVARIIEPDFGPARARTIAVTEITNVIGAGAQAQYRVAGFQFWEWRTVKDARVDPICEARSGQQFPMAIQFRAAHPRCRCWPVPAGDPVVLFLPGLAA